MITPEQLYGGATFCLDGDPKHLVKIIYIGKEKIFYEHWLGEEFALPISIALSRFHIIKKVKYLNLYPFGFSHVSYDTRCLADKHAGDGRTGCIRIEYGEGQFDDDK